MHVEVFQSTVNHISEHDGFLAISYGCFVAIYKIERSLHYLTEEGVRPFVKFFRSFKNPIPVKGALIVDSPLYSLVLYDNANIRVYSINGQLIRSCSCNAKTICRIVDAEMNHFLLLIEEERLLCLSTPDLRCISELEVRNVVDSFGNLLVFAN